MDLKTLTDIVDLAWEDIRGAEPGAIGMVAIVTTHNRDGDIEMHMLATTPPDVVAPLLLSAAQHWLVKDAVRQRKITRKTP